MHDSSYIPSNGFNVHEHLKLSTVDQIKQYCVSRQIPCAVAMFNITGDFNLGTVIRNANFFGFREVFYIGRKKYDRRSTVGTHNYTGVINCGDEAEFFETIKDKYTPIAIENNINFKTENLFDITTWPDNPIIIFGEENLGISDDVLSRCNKIITIPDYGSIRSLNVGTTSGIVMSEIRKCYEKSKKS